MGQIDTTFATESYETRELAWELQQSHPDQQRIRFLLENEANLPRALLLSKLRMEDILKKPALRQLQLQNRLEALPLE